MYRMNLYKAMAVVFSLISFAALAQYSLYAVSPEGERAAMDRIHREAMAEHAEWKRQQIMELWNITESDLARPVDLFGEKGKI